MTAHLEIPCHDSLTRRMHRHGSTALQTHQAGMPVIVDHADASGFDYLGTPSCAAIRPYIYGAPEIIMHLQTLLFAVNSDGNGIDQDQTGPTDDGYISSALATVPQDPYCCKGPSIQPDGAASAQEHAWRHHVPTKTTPLQAREPASQAPLQPAPACNMLLSARSEVCGQHSALHSTHAAVGLSVATTHAHHKL